MEKESWAQTPYHQPIHSLALPHTEMQMCCTVVFHFLPYTYPDNHPYNHLYTLPPHTKRSTQDPHLILSRSIYSPPLTPYHLLTPSLPHPHQKPGHIPAPRSITQPVLSPLSFPKLTSTFPSPSLSLFTLPITSISTPTSKSSIHSIQPPYPSLKLLPCGVRDIPNRIGCIWRSVRFYERFIRVGRPK